MKVFFVFSLFIFSSEAWMRVFWLENCAMKEAMVHIFAVIDTPVGNDYVKICEGSIFYRDWVLTAASCIITDKDGLIFSRSRNPKAKNAIIYKPLEIRIHPDYNRNDDNHIQYNLALIKFEINFKFTIPFLRGFILTYEDILLNQKECQKIYGSQRKIIDNLEMCVSTTRGFSTTNIGRFVTFGNRTIDDFDFEDIYDGYGIVSEVGSCGGSYPVILTNIRDQWPWISKAIGTQHRFCKVVNYTYPFDEIVE